MCSTSEAGGGSKLAALGDVSAQRASLQKLEFRDAQTITEVCSGESLPEVEIISLIEEQIPRYRLRADTLTQFTGYENQDWFIPSPALQISDADLKLSPDQIRETLNYFLLCSNRVSQMTKTYNDIEAVTRLLEEKEKDLELTARIGKELLQHNNKLEHTVNGLESELKVANEKITQLSHDVLKKAELIHVLTSDTDSESSSTAGTPSGARGINLDLLQRRIGSLEDENKSLRQEFTRLVTDTDLVEAQEQRLVKDIAMQLSSANWSVGSLADELERQKEENRLQHEQILALTAKLADAEMRLHKFTVENEEVSSLLHITKENQSCLAGELADFKERYLEVAALLRDTQEQLRKLRRKQQPMVRGAGLFSSLTPAADSLQSELEGSMYSDHSLDSGIAAFDRVPTYKKVFETVRCASRSSLSSSSMEGSAGSGKALGLSLTTSTMVSSGGGPRMSSQLIGGGGGGSGRYSGSIYSSSSLGYPSLDSAGVSDTESMNTDSESDNSYPGGHQPGIPGIPGAADLEAALRRLTPTEISARRAHLQHGLAFGGYDVDGCRTPDSIMSTGSSGLGTWRLPDKLQIVKPMEGSHTLQQWATLAQPTLGGLLDERPGVKIRGGRELEDIGLETYALSDLEEDEEYGNPGKRFEPSSCIYTITNSTVMHPDDGTTSVTHSTRGSRIASVCSSTHASPPQTPRMSRRNSTSTFSTTYGLAKMLNERGIKAVTPSAVTTPRYTPTATPCNSPDSSPNSSRAASPEPFLPSLISTGSRFLQRALIGDAHKPPPHGASKSKPKSKQQHHGHHHHTTDKQSSIVEKLDRLGIQSIMGGPGALALSAGLYNRPALTSPMAQLTCLLPPSAAEPASPHMGQPAKPGTGALDRRLQQLAARRQSRQTAARPRPDLGTVQGQGAPRAAAASEQHSSALGTLSSLLFGRKGGLL